MEHKCLYKNIICSNYSIIETIAIKVIEKLLVQFLS